MNDTNTSSARVVVTRPAIQGERLAELIEAGGGTALRIPALEISAAARPQTATKHFKQLDRYDYLVFISPNAVRYSLEYFDPAQLDQQTTVAIGASTARAMAGVDIPCHLHPRHGFTSEALLELPELAQLQDKKILIIRGNGGRELLGRGFESRGAEVDYAEVYQRGIPEESKTLLNDVLQHDAADLVIANSVETLGNIVSITADQWQDKLLNLQLVTGSPRVVQKAADLGFRQSVLLADGPDDHALMHAISGWSTTAHASAANPHLTETNMTQNTPDTEEHETNNAGDDRAEATPEAEAEAEVAPEAHATPDDGGTADTRTEPAAEVAASPVAKNRSGIAWLALLLALVAMLSSGLAWWQNQQRPDPTADIEIPTSAEILAAVREDTERFNAGVERQTNRLQQQLEDAASEHSEFASSIRTQQRGVETLTGQLGQMEQSISAMRGVSANIRNTWVRAETEYFLQIANTRLQLAGDVNSAVQALRAADERIVALGDPALTPVRAQISEELLALDSVPMVDVEGIALALNSLARRVSKLSLTNSAPESLRRAGGGDDEKSGWGRAKGVVSNAFTDIVRISPTDDSHPALLAPEQAYFLYRNLELQLQSARIAAMQGQQQNYADSIASSLGWLERFFDPADSGVPVVIKRLEELRTKRVTTELPDISGSLNMLRAIAPGSSSSAVPRPSPATGNAAGDNS